LTGVVVPLVIVLCAGALICISPQVIRPHVDVSGSEETNIVPVLSLSNLFLAVWNNLLSARIYVVRLH
jgi:hypothetical protein